VVRSITRWLSAIVFVLGAAAAAAAQDGLIETIKKRGTLVVGNATFVPWAMRSKSGELIGFEIDVAKKVAEDLGVKVDFQPTAWSGIIPALLAGKFDVIIGGMSITPERAQTVDFTIPYSTSGQAIVANKALAGSLGPLQTALLKQVDSFVATGNPVQAKSAPQLNAEPSLHIGPWPMTPDDLRVWSVWRTPNFRSVSAPLLIWNRPSSCA